MFAINRLLLVFTLCSFFIPSGCDGCYYKKQNHPTSFLLFTLEKNQLSIERYMHHEIEVKGQALTTPFRQNHTLFNIDLTDGQASLSSVDFYPDDPGYIIISTSRYQYLIYWPALITKNTNSYFL